MVVEYVKLDPMTLEPSLDGIYYKIATSERGMTSYEAVNGHLDDDGNWVPDPPPPPPEPTPTPEQQEITQLKDELLQTKLALAELADVNEKNKTNLQLAIAELAAIITGGAE